jgi:hypothetical protein
MARTTRQGIPEMSINVVNLDALIPREDFAVDEAQTRAIPPDRINIAHLDGHFFAGDLRKPDFQRETMQWSPAKVVDLIRSFLDADLIPAVILWRAGQSIFVIDGAHRFSAMLAWIKDDYGDRKTSLDHAGGFITEEQRRVAERTLRRSPAHGPAATRSSCAAPGRRRSSRIAGCAATPSRRYRSLLAEWRGVCRDAGQPGARYHCLRAIAGAEPGSDRDDRPA